jgi:hypothetical protein
MTRMSTPIDFLSQPAPRDIGTETYDAVRRALDEALVELGPWDDEPTKPGGHDE